jgi:hypothetical protein
VRPLVRAAFIAPEVVKALKPVLPCFLRRHGSCGTRSSYWGAV